MNKPIKTILTCILASSMLFTGAFAAIPAGHWFESIVPTVIEKGIYPSVTSDNFEPDINITYKDFTTMANLATGRAIAYNGDLANEPIKRIEILKIINERMNYNESDLTEEQKILTAINMADFNQMAQEDKTITLAACANGIVKGNQNSEIRPRDNATFAEALTMLSRIDIEPDEDSQYDAQQYDEYSEQS